MHIENEGNRPEESKYELNPDHSHFLLVRDDTVNKTGLNYFLIRLEQHLASLAESPDRGAPASPFSLKLWVWASFIMV